MEYHDRYRSTPSQKARLNRSQEKNFHNFHGGNYMAQNRPFMQQDESEAPHYPDPYNDELEITHSQTIGDRGPVVLQDTILHENLETFVHAKSMERAVHVKGFGAFGYFQCTNSMQAYTMLPFLQSPNQRTQTVSRFSLAVSTKGTPDTSRNVRGFSTKFYTDYGIFDLLCNHLPVFSVRDAIRFPESIKAFLPSPVNNLGDGNRFWSFVARAPESMLFVVWLYSDVGTVKSLRHIRTYGVNTYIWKNAAGKRHYVKYHWLPLAGEESIDRAEAARLAGANPDVAGQDLYDTISSGTPVEYELRVQLMDPDDYKKLPYDPLDCTKVWSETDYPLMPVGKLVLNQNPDNYQEQIEMLAFSPANLLEGAEFSADKMLQGRTTIYWDAQRSRLGAGFRSIPINHQANWTPNDLTSSGLGEMEEGRQTRSDLPKPDDFAQAGEYYESLSDTQKDHLVDNLAADLAGLDNGLKNTILDYLDLASSDLAKATHLRISHYKN